MMERTPAGRDPAECPRLRPIDAKPVRIGGSAFVEVRDPMGYTDVGLRMPPAAFFLANLFDGETSLEEIQAAFARQFGEDVPRSQILDIAARLDEAGFLEGERFEKRKADAVSMFRAMPARLPSHAGLCYSEDPDALKKELDAYFDPPGGPGFPDPLAEGAIPRGIIAPHIDPPRGGHLYARAYKCVAERGRPVRTFVILGTGHAAPGCAFIPTRKDFANPLGLLPIENRAVDAFANAMGPGAFEHEWLHKSEHSIEFQCLFLRHALGGDHPFRIVPILCGSFAGIIEEGRDPSDDEDVTRAIDALLVGLAGVAPIAPDRFFALHYAKLAAQSRDTLATWSARATTLGLASGALDDLRGRLDEVRGAV